MKHGTLKQKKPPCKWGLCHWLFYIDWSMWWKVLNIQTQPAIDNSNPVNGSRCIVKTTPKNIKPKLSNKDMINKILIITI